MKKCLKKLLCLALCICVMLSVCISALAADNDIGTYAANSYPYVFVHGMMGWGENAQASSGYPYWGFSDEANIPEYLRSKGYTVSVPSVGPMSSAWDRACELYAQLTGTRVDYGEAHSKRCGHARYGRDYTGRPVMDGGWDLKTPINLVSHSFGGPAIAIFASVMEYGCQEEIDTCDDCSEFFKGGKPGLVYSVSTLAAPFNGSPLANLLYDIKIPVYIAGLVMNTFNLKLGTDYMLDQFGITEDPATGKTASLNLSGVKALYNSDDHCAYDMSIQGARELWKKYPVAKNTYYFAYSCNLTDDGLFGRKKVSNEFAVGIFGITGNIICACAGKYIGGEKLGNEWAANDGFVPVVSAQYPFTQAHVDYTDGMQVEKGIWNTMPVIENASHGYHVAGNGIPDFYDQMVTLIENL